MRIKQVRSLEFICHLFNITNNLIIIVKNQLIYVNFIFTMVLYIFDINKGIDRKLRIRIFQRNDGP